MFLTICVTAYFIVLLVLHIFVLYLDSFGLLKSVYDNYTTIIHQLEIWNESFGMLLVGQTQHYVERQFNVSHTVVGRVVGRVWQRYLDTGSVDERAGRGRPRKTTDVYL